MNKSHRTIFVLLIFFVKLFLVLLPINANSAPPRPVAIFVNGDQNCCAANMSKTWRALQNLGVKVDYSAWNSITAHNMGSNPRSTQNFIRSATNYFNSLPSGTDIYLIGHSFGGDSILQLLGSYRRSHVNFRLVAILDAIGVGGRRDVTLGNSIPANVDYFFNRWQKNAPWPVDISTSGKIRCHAKTCNQKEQSFSRSPDGTTRTTECTRVERCPGAEIRTGRNGLPFYYSGVKKTRLHHSFVPTDPYIEEQIINIVTQLTNQRCRNTQSKIVRVGSASVSFGRNKSWKTCTGYETVFQRDGNFVVYNPSGLAVFNTGTQGRGGKELVMQTDGNLVIYSDTGEALWHTHTNGNPGAFLAIQEDGNVVIYDRNSRPIFNTGTNGK